MEVFLLKVSVIIPTRNRANLLKKNLLQLASLGEVNEIVVVDDASTDGTSKIVRSLSKVIHERFDIVLKLRRNRRRMLQQFCWNKAMKLAKGDIIIFLNDDTLLKDKYAVRAIRKRMERDPKIALIGAKINDVNPKTENIRFYLNLFGAPLSKVTSFPFIEKGNTPRYVEYVSSVMAVRKDLIKELAFNENYRGTGYREESDFQLVIRKKGWKILYEPTFEVFHIETYGGGYRGFTLSDRMYWKARNHTYFIRKHFNGMKSFWFLLCGLIMLLVFRPWNIARVLKGFQDGFQI